jgi:hypothetical protein
MLSSEYRPKLLATDEHAEPSRMKSGASIAGSVVLKRSIVSTHQWLARSATYRILGD